MPVKTAEGEQAVLKVQQPHRESEHEAAALELWDGDGAIRLLDSEPEAHMLLLERCVPGTPLSEAGGEAALDVFGSPRARRSGRSRARRSGGAIRWRRRGSDSAARSSAGCWTRRSRR